MVVCPGGVSPVDSGCCPTVGNGAVGGAGFSLTSGARARSGIEGCNLKAGGIATPGTVCSGEVTSSNTGFCILGAGVKVLGTSSIRQAASFSDSATGLGPSSGPAEPTSFVPKQGHHRIARISILEETAGGISSVVGSGGTGISTVEAEHVPV